MEVQLACVLLVLQEHSVLQQVGQLAPFVLLVALPIRLECQNAWNAPLEHTLITPAHAWHVLMDFSVANQDKVLALLVHRVMFNLEETVLHAQRVLSENIGLTQTPIAPTVLSASSTVSVDELPVMIACREASPKPQALLHVHYASLEALHRTHHSVRHV